MRTIPILAVLTLSSPLQAQAILPPFDRDDSFVDLGTPSGISTAFGGCAFEIGDPDTLYLGGAANASSGVAYRIPLARDAQEHSASS